MKIVIMVSDNEHFEDPYPAGVFDTRESALAAIRLIGEPDGRNPETFGVDVIRKTSPNFSHFFRLEAVNENMVIIE